MLVSGYSLVHSNQQESQSVKAGLTSYTQSRIEQKAEKQEGDYEVHRSPGSCAGELYPNSYVIGTLEGFYGKEQDSFAEMPKEIDLYTDFYSVNKDGEVCLYQDDEKVRICYIPV